MELKDNQVQEYHPIQERIVSILRNQTQNYESDHYFRILIVFYMAQLSTAMRAKMVTEHRGTLPTNIYALNLGESGMGKGHSQHIIEHQLMKGFRTAFLSSTFPIHAARAMDDAARTEAIRNNTEEAEELKKLEKEFHSYGNYIFSYDSGTGPAFKQLRTKCQIADIGSMNLIADEIGSNILTHDELFATHLEAYDIGLIKQKLIKNSAESQRAKDRDDPVPTNMLCFGTPSRLFTGGKEEDELMNQLAAGYARRMLFGHGQKTATTRVTAEERFTQMTENRSSAEVDSISDLFTQLADSSNIDRQIALEKPEALINIEYQLQCEAEAEGLLANDELRKAELQHRYFKTLKLAAIYAFIDGSYKITEENMYAAIRLVEDSATCFQGFMTRERNYARLAKHIAEVDSDVTHADLTEDLPFYPESKAKRDDMMQLAIAWGSRNNIIIKKTFDGSIEFFKGESLKEIDLDKIKLSYSDHQAYGYLNKEIPWDKLGIVAQAEGYHWVNHWFTDGHRCTDSVVSGFNTVVVDVDKDCTLETAKELLKDYKAIFYITKRHTAEDNRFRIILPLKYTLDLGEKDYKDFMLNIYSWLPFSSDEDTAQRCRKWLCNDGGLSYVEGELLDPVQFIPKTIKNTERIKEAEALGNLDRIETWFARTLEDGNRNNTMLKFALMLLDSGLDPADVEASVLAFNGKIKNSLSDGELKATVLKTMWRRSASVAA